MKQTMRKIKTKENTKKVSQDKKKIIQKCLNRTIMKHLSLEIFEFVDCNKNLFLKLFSQVFKRFFW